MIDVIAAIPEENAIAPLPPSKEAKFVSRFVLKPRGMPSRRYVAAGYGSLQVLLRLRRGWAIGGEAKR